jgi:predicted ATPase
MIDSLLMENFRCFAGAHEAPVRLVTLLVGENSSGKSSFLAATRLAWDCSATLGTGKNPDFNEEPFQLGAYRQIAASTGTKSAPRFSLGLGLGGAQMRVTFGEAGAQPSLIHERTPEGESFHSFSVKARSRPVAFAPIRIRPKRTYDPVQDLPDPSGIHVPMILARIEATDETSWKRIAEMLRRFGKASGLLQDLEVRRLGKDDDPFQVEVKIHGKSFNLMDVGYGVSQILPILVECTRGPREAVFLLQQPEVHLHPRAQAELGSFFATLAKEREQQFLIETHSDHLVDRLRLEVRQGKLAPDDLVILYFERDKSGARIHPMTTDEQGNLLDAPEAYRQFFLEEERRLLGF